MDREAQTTWNGQVRIIRSRRRTLSLEVRGDLTVVVRAPLGLPDREVKRFLGEKAGWLEKHLARAAQRRQAALSKLTGEEIRALAEGAAEVIPRRVAHFAPAVGVTWGKITIRSQVSRWGSCSAKGNLSFNCLLMLCPPQVLDYVVVHELCHRKHMDHSAAFWREVERVMPEWESSRVWLREQGGALIARLRQE